MAWPKKRLMSERHRTTRISPVWTVKRTHHKVFYHHDSWAERGLKIPFNVTCACNVRWMLHSAKICFALVKNKIVLVIFSVTHTHSLTPNTHTFSLKLLLSHQQGATLNHIGCNCICNGSSTAEVFSWSVSTISPSLRTFVFHPLFPLYSLVNLEVF